MSTLFEQINIYFNKFTVCKKYYNFNFATRASKILLHHS